MFAGVARTPGLGAAQNFGQTKGSRARSRLKKKLRECRVESRFAVGYWKPPNLDRYSHHLRGN